jgi:hypothetical protein
MGALEFPGGGIDNQVHILQGDRPQQHLLRAGVSDTKSPW